MALALSPTLATKTRSKGTILPQLKSGPTRCSPRRGTWSWYLPSSPTLMKGFSAMRGVSRTVTVAARLPWRPQLLGGAPIVPTKTMFQTPPVEPDASSAFRVKYCCWLPAFILPPTRTLPTKPPLEKPSPMPFEYSASMRLPSMIARRTGVACDVAQSMLPRVRKFSAPRQNVARDPKIVWLLLSSQYTPFSESKMTSSGLMPRPKTCV